MDTGFGAVEGDAARPAAGLMVGLGWGAPAAPWAAVCGLGWPAGMSPGNCAHFVPGTKHGWPLDSAPRRSLWACVT